MLDFFKVGLMFPPPETVRTMVKLSLLYAGLYSAKDEPSSIFIGAERRIKSCKYYDQIYVVFTVFWFVSGVNLMSGQLFSRLPQGYDFHISFTQ